MDASVALVLDQVDTVQALRRSPRTKRRSFAIDLSLVAHGVRAGHLVDALSPPNPIQTFPTLLKSLRDKSATFNDVACWHHAPTMQSFFVHMPLLQDRLDNVLRGECVFVTLDRSVSASRECPDRLREALRDVRNAMAASPDALLHLLPDVFTEETLVPLAAVMIDYPVAFCPAYSGQTSFLDGEALDIYTVSFKRTEMEHVMFKFSCPRVLVHDHPELSPGALVEQLRAKLTARLDHIGARMIVSHHTETLDRIAL